MTPSFDPALFDTIRVGAALSMVVAAALAVWAGRRPAAILAVCGALVAVGFPGLTIQRPFGLFADKDLTLRYARAGVAANVRGARAEIVPQAPAPRVSLLSAIAGAGIPVSTMAPILRLAPALLLLATALALGRLAGRSRGTPFEIVTAGLWLVLSTGDLETLRGVGFLPGSWRHAAAGVLIVLELSLLAWLPARATAWWKLVAGVALAIPWCWMGRPGSAVTLNAPEVVLLMTLDQGVLGFAALVGATRSSAACIVLLATSAGLLAIHGITGAVDPWGPAVLYRAALMLLVGPVVETTFRATARLINPEASPASGRRMVSAIALSLGILVLGAGSFAVWWRPERLDPLLYDSRLPLPDGMGEAMAWVRERTPADAVFVTSAGFAPALAALGGRRVVRAKTLLDTPDDDLRRRAQDDLVERCEISDLVRRYGITHVLRGPASLLWRDTGGSADPIGKPCFKLAYSGPFGYRIFEVVVN